MHDLTVDVLISPAKWDTGVCPNRGAEIAPTKESNRIPALDFTKGTLVLIMVLYHWMNYFVKADGSIYRYLRFLTPSFIFITGFLISTVYLHRYRPSGLRVPRRLMVRGIKLLTIVLCLNVAQSAAHLKGFETRVSDWTIRHILAAYLTGIAPVAFSVLVPIAYLLILSAGLLVVARHYRHTYHVISGVSVGSALLLELNGIQSDYLQLVSIGMLGISVGYIPIDRINSFVKRSLAIFLMYLAYLFAITLWDAIYVLQIVGVCLSLAVIYRIGVAHSETSRIRKIVILLGQYSLFGYIAQIVILQSLRRSWLPLSAGIGVSGGAFVVGIACTILSVVVLDRARVMNGVNKLYTTVFC
jgi:peptidoglycan/LPS O-acetylase OafA/YrhL